MERILTLHIERLPEGVYLATSDDIQGLVALGRAIQETLEIARDVARKLMTIRPKSCNNTCDETENVMALQLGALRDALLDAGAAPDNAAKAAKEMAGYENRLAGMDSRLTLLTWVVGFNLVLTSSVLWRLLSH